MDDKTCQWPECQGKIYTIVIDDKNYEKLALCRHHRGIALINLEQHGKIRPTSGNQKKVSQLHPGDIAKQKSNKRPESQPVSWEKEAAKKADAKAMPVEDQKFDDESVLKKFSISNVVKQRK